MNYYETDYKFYSNTKKSDNERRDIDFLEKIQNLITEYNKNNSFHFWLRLTYGVRKFS